MYFANLVHMRIGYRTIPGLIKRVIKMKKGDRRIFNVENLERKKIGEIRIRNTEIIVMVREYKGIFTLDGKLICEKEGERS